MQKQVRLHEGDQLMAPVPESCKKKRVRLREEGEEEEECQIAKAGQIARRRSADGACA